jgi:hypothetical protein
MASSQEPRPYKVIVVVDPDFGERLADLPPGVPVWVMDTETNRSVTHRLRKERPAKTHLDGITTFRGGSASGPDEVLINEFSTIDLHHGPYSADPPYSELEIYGVSATPVVRSALEHIGFEVTASTDTGFQAVRRTPISPAE